MMIKRSLRLWWLILAWILVMLGDDFWHFNVMELFASIAIILGAILTILHYLREWRRKDTLIFFPNEWRATRDLSHAVLEVTAIAEVRIPHYAFSYNAYGFIQGERVPFQFAKPHQAALTAGYWYMSGTIPLSSVIICPLEYRQCGIKH